MTIDQLILRKRQHNEMLRYVIEHAPLEACGLGRLWGARIRVGDVVGGCLASGCGNHVG